jgi:hypothetical protein
LTVPKQPSICLYDLLQEYARPRAQQSPKPDQGAELNSKPDPPPTSAAVEDGGTPAE